MLNAEKILHGITFGGTVMTIYENNLTNDEMSEYSKLMLERNALKAAVDRSLSDDEYEDDLENIQHIIDKFNLDHGMDLHDWERAGK